MKEIAKRWLLAPGLARSILAAALALLTQDRAAPATSGASFSDEAFARGWAEE